MSRPKNTIEFAAPVLGYVDRGMRLHYLPLPSDIADDLLSKGIKRLVGTMNGTPFNRAIQVNKGERLFILGRTILKEIGAVRGDTIIVIMWPDPTPDEPELPEELVEVLAQEPEAAARFYGFTPGKQRSYAIYVTGVKRTETRIKRALDLAHKLRTHTLHEDK